MSIPDLDISTLTAELHLAVAVEFHRKGWIYIYPPPSGDSPEDVALLIAYKMGLERGISLITAFRDDCLR